VSEQSQPATTWAAVLGFLAVVGGALIRMFTRRQKDSRDNEAGIVKIYSDERLEILRMYRQEITDLKSQIAEMAARHKMEMESMALENRDLRKRVTELESRLEAM
jgi:hypothetical protein